MKFRHVGALLLLAAVCFGWLQYYGKRAAKSVGSEIDGRFSAAKDTDSAALGDPQQILRSAVEADSALLAAIDPDLDLRGVVIDACGTPIAEASLAAMVQLNQTYRGTGARASDVEERQEAQSWSDELGRFRIRLRAHQTYDLIVTKETFAALRVSGLYAGEERVIVLHQAASIAGRVQDAGTGDPIADVIVRLMPREFMATALLQRTNELGEYVFQNLPASEYTLDFQSLAHVRRYGVQVLLDEGEQTREDVTLERGSSIHGRVTDGVTSRPIAGAELRIRAQLCAVSTDAEGRYRLEGVPLDFRDSLQIRAKGYGEFDFPITAVPPEGLEQDIGLLPGRTARGRVVDREGAPVPRAKLAAEAHTSRSQYGNWQTDRQIATSEESGEFLIEDLRVDLRHTLEIRAEGFAAAIYDFPASEWESTELDLGDLILEPECSIAGVVVTPAGAPLPDLLVSLHGEAWRRDALAPARSENEGYMNTGGLGFGDLYARTDARGRFAFATLAAGSYSLWAGKKGYATGVQQEVELLYEGDSITDLELVLDPGYSIAGVVTDGAGDPVSQAVVAIAPESDPKRRLTYAIAGADGSFLLAGLEIGSYRLTADAGFHESNAEGWEGRRFGEIELHGIAAGSKELRISLPDAARISGTVFGPEGEPVRDAILFFCSRGESLWRGVGNSQQDGSFEFWLTDGTSGSLHVIPPMIVFAGQPLDRSMEVVLPEIRTGDTGLVVKLPRLR